MADTPRGPRPTVTRRTAVLLALAWLVVPALLVVATVASRTALEGGWSRDRLEIVRFPYGECEGDTCTIKPTVALPSGEERRVTLTVADESELLPSAHFREGGSLLLWVREGDEPQARRPVTAAGRVTVGASLAAALALAVGSGAAAWRARRAHDPRHAGHVLDHLVVRAAPALVAVVAVVLLVVARDHATPRYEPLLPEQPSSAGRD